MSLIQDKGLIPAQSQERLKVVYCSKYLHFMSLIQDKGLIPAQSQERLKVVYCSKYLHFMSLIQDKGLIPAQSQERLKVGPELKNCLFVLYLPSILTLGR